MKYKRLFKILCFIENLIASIISIACLIVFVSVPTGTYTIKFILIKLLALVILTLILKVEGVENWYYYE